MAKRSFDKKFGPEFMEGLPASPGVYRVFSAAGELIYIGKAKNLRRRLAQYRNAKRCKKHRKMREIVGSAARILHEICATELEAELLETRLIQEHRPRFNVAGAFSFLYPLIGMRWKDGTASFLYTNRPELFAEQGFELHGAFRSRWITGEAFFALVKLLSYVGHRVPGKARKPGSTSYVFAFRRIPEEWAPLWNAFWKGESKEALEELILALVENAAARKRKSDTQEKVDSLIRFWKHEAKRLREARESLAPCPYPVPQAERDLLFLNYRHRRREKIRSKVKAKAREAVVASLGASLGAGSGD